MTSSCFNYIEPVFGGRNSRIFRLVKNKNIYGLKFFRKEANNARDRLNAETSALDLFAKNGIECVPKLVAIDRVNNCILLEWINGQRVTDFRVKDINLISDFVQAVHDIYLKFNCDEIRFATDACVNGAEIVCQINRRLEKLKLSYDKHPELEKFIRSDFVPAFHKILDWSKNKYMKSDLNFDRDISPEQMTLSPVDIGLHNCLRTENKLYFLDFEFFGRDDPVKLVADTLQHPGSSFNQKDSDYLKIKFQKIYDIDHQFQVRLKCLYPLFGLKWCMIMLNPFLLRYVLKDHTRKKEIQKEQLVRVKLRTERLVKITKNNYAW